MTVDIQNAYGDRDRFVQIAEQMIDNGAKVLMIVSLDRQSGADALRKAREAGVKTIDYDRLTVGGGADFHVGFDNVKAGEMAGKGLIDCVQKSKIKNPVVAELNGSPSDNNATLLKQGYDRVLQPKYDDASWTKGPDQDVPDWDQVQAGAVFEQMLTQQPRIRGVLAASDGIAGAAIDVLKARGLAGQVPVTGQDATLEGLRRVLTGEQCMTVYRAVGPEAQAAVNVAIDLYNGWTPTAKSLGLDGVELDQIKDPETGAFVPFLGITPELITKSNMQTVVNDSFIFPSDLCAGEQFKKLCLENGIR